jgi:hypothetical protein
MHGIAEHALNGVCAQKLEESRLLDAPQRGILLLKRAPAKIPDLLEASR